MGRKKTKALFKTTCLKCSIVVVPLNHLLFCFSAFEKWKKTPLFTICFTCMFDKALQTSGPETCANSSVSLTCSAIPVQCSSFIEVQQCCKNTSHDPVKNKVWQIFDPGAGAPCRGAARKSCRKRMQVRCKSSITRSYWSIIKDLSFVHPLSFVESCVHLRN